MPNNTAPPFNFMAQYIDLKQPSGFSFVGQQQFAAMQQQLANLQSLVNAMQAQIGALNAKAGQ